MSYRPVSRALLQVLAERATGTLTINADGRTSSISLHEGAVVAAALNAGHQTAAQGLLRQGRLSLGTLDALWARGAAAALDEDFLEGAGMPQERPRIVQLAATVRRLDALGAGVAFERGTVAPRFRWEAALVLGALAELPTDGLEEDGRTMEDADKRAQEALAREINEALRRAGVTPVEPVPEAAPEHDLLPVIEATPEPDPEPPGVLPSPSDDDSWGALLEGVEPELPPQLVDAVLVPPPPPEPAPAPVPRGDPAEEARLRRQRLLLRGMENLGTLPRPMSPQGAVRVEPQPVQPPAPPLSGAMEAEAPVEPASGDEAQLARRIEAKWATLSGKRDFFAVLEVGRDANRDGVKAAFLSQAKLFHPDRLPPALKHLSQKMAAVFEAVREAYEWLYDDQRRRDYLLTLEEAAPSAASEEARTASRAAEEYRKAELLLRKRDFAAAEEAFAHAYGLDRRAEYLAGRGWAVYMDPARRGDVSRAKQMMVDALKVNPGCDRAHYQLGVIARVANDVTAAERHFREALRTNPRHTEANQELRLIEMRKRKDPPKKGLFK